MSCDYNPYSLPSIDFVAGETQDFAFHVFSSEDNLEMKLSTCTANFSVVSFINRAGTPVISKSMEVQLDSTSNARSILAVQLSSADTIDLCGKYVYQITIKDEENNTAIQHGLLFITSNINKSFLS